MKKVFISSLVSLALPIICAATVFADNTLPIVADEYQVKITNPSGACVYTDQSPACIDNISYNSLINVRDVLGYIEPVECSSSDARCRIDEKDIEFMKAVEGEESSATKIAEPYKLFVFQEGVELREYPSAKFGSVKKQIPVGTVLSVNNLENGRFVFVEDYEGESGWVYYDAIGDGTFGGQDDLVALYMDNAIQFYVFREAKVYDSPYPGKANLIGRLPVGINISSNIKHSYSADSLFSYYVEYGSIKGWVTFGEKSQAADGVAEVVDKKYMTIADLELYLDANLSMTTATIPAFTEVAVTCATSNMNYFCVNYNGYNGIVHFDQAEEVYYRRSFSEYRKTEGEVDEKTAIYDLPNGNKLALTISGQQTMTYDYEACLQFKNEENYSEGCAENSRWFYHAGNDFTGWINEVDSQYTEPVEPVEDKNHQTQPAKNDSDSSDTTKKDSNLFLIIIIIAGIIAIGGIIILVIMRLIAKKKSPKTSKTKKH